MRATIAANKQFIIVVLLAELVIAACLPLARMLDASSDRQQPMYRAMFRIADLEYKHAVEDGGAVPVSVPQGHTVNVGAQPYSPPRGVSLAVDATSSDSYCVRASNAHGDTTGWRCWSDETDPTKSDGYER